MPTRPRHPDKDLERLLKDAEAQGWRVEKGSGYFHLWCPCEDKHKSSVHLTPKKHYAKNLRKKLLRWTCWEEGR